MHWRSNQTPTKTLQSETIMTDRYPLIDYWCESTIIRQTTNSHYHFTHYLTKAISWQSLEIKDKNMIFDFLLLARYVPTIAKRSTWEQCIYWGLTTDRPTSHFRKIWTAISRQRVIRSTSNIKCLVLVGFSKSADRMALLPVGPNPRWRLAAILENFKWPCLCNGSSDRLRVWS